MDFSAFFDELDKIAAVKGTSSWFRDRERTLLSYANRAADRAKELADRADALGRKVRDNPTREGWAKVRSIRNWAETYMRENILKRGKAAEVSMRRANLVAQYLPWCRLRPRQRAS